MSPTPGHLRLPDRAGHLHVGGHRRRGRRAVRRPARADRPVRPQHLPDPARPGRDGCSRPAGSRRSLSEYPPSDYRRLVGRGGRALRRRRRRARSSGAGADEILDLVAKAFLPPGGRAVVPVPTYAMYRVLTEQRGAAGRRGATRSAADAGWALDLDAVRAAAGDADGRLALQPEQPDRAARARRRDRGACSRGLAADADRDGRAAPIVVLDEAYAEFVGGRSCRSAPAYPNLIVVRTASKAYALAGLRVGFAIARPAVIARLNPYRPPGSVSTVSVTRRHRGPRATTRSSTPTSSACDVERDAPGRRPARRRLGRRPVGHELPPRRLRLAGTGGGRRRGPPAPRPRAAHLPGRATRSPASSGSRSATADENDRLIAAPPRDDRPDRRRRGPA